MTKSYEVPQETRRERFAAAALTGLLTNRNPHEFGFDYAGWAHAAVLCADELLSALEKKKEGPSA